MALSQEDPRAETWGKQGRQAGSRVRGRASGRPHPGSSRRQGQEDWLTGRWSVRGAGGVKADSRAFGLSSGSVDLSSIDVGKAIARMPVVVVVVKNLWVFF